jgi:uncharacterized membrane protein
MLEELHVREKLKLQLTNDRIYNGLFTAVCLLGLVLIIWGKSAAPFYMVWEPPFNQRYLAYLLMIPACILTVAGFITNSYIRWQVRNPLLTASALWATAHLWTNGDLSSILLFGSFALWSLMKLVTLRHQSIELKPELSWLWRDLTAVVFGLTIYLTIYISHGYLFGVGLAIQ